MTTRRFAWFLSSVACLTVLVYLGLVVLAASCVFMPVASSGAHHHAQESAAHSPLCAWSCQMISQSGPATSALTVLLSLVVISAAVPLVHSHAISPSVSRPSRAPPVSTLG